MTFEIKEIVKKVLHLLDENEEILQEKIEFGIAGTNLAELIPDIVLEVAPQCILEADTQNLNESIEADVEVEWEGPGRGRVLLPNDFLRLVSFRMSDWKRSLTRFMDYGSEAYQLRFFPAKGRAGIRKSPAAAICREGTHAWLEFIGSTDPGAYAERFSYIPRPEISQDGHIWLPQSLLPEIVRASANYLLNLQNQTI